ncbi:MAG: bacillithiol biosynthesis cysteine-adding enzyme BshC, partial [Gemmatimonadota bacterium]
MRDATPAMRSPYEIETQPLTGSALVRDHRQAFDRVSRFYPAGPAARLETFRRAAEDARSRIPEARYRSLPDALRPSGAAARQKLERVVGERGVIVTAGQQAGLFTGPLYTVHKTWTVIALAGRLERELGLPVLPVFWVASEDHDWEEINHVHVVDVENRLRRLGVGAPAELAGGTPPVFRLSLPPDVADALAALEAATPDSEFKDGVLGPLREAYAPGANVAAAFANALANLFADTSLCLLDAADPWVKSNSTPVLEREWARRRDVSARLAEWTRELEAAGYETQVQVDPGATNLFVEGPTGRDRLLFDPEGDGARLRRSGQVVSERDLLGWLRESPDRVGPNVLLRPVVESFLLPVAATVGGPAEIAYHAQTPPLFEIHGVRPPPVVPRAAFRIVERRVARALEKTGVTADDLATGPENVARALARDRIPESIESGLDGLARELAEGFDRLGPEIEGLDASLQGAVGRARHAMEGALEELRAKVTSSVQRRNETLLEQLRKAAVHLWPLGQPQERVLNVYPYLIRY